MADIIKSIFGMVKEYGPWALVLGLLAAKFVPTMSFLGWPVIAGFDLGVTLAILWVAAYFLKK